MSKCNDKDLSFRGPDSVQQTTYDNTVADYTSTVSGDNTVANVTCDAGVIIGDVVYINGTTAEKARADVYSTSLVVGIVTAKPTGTTCDIITTGPTNVISGLDTSKQYFLSDTTAGTLITTPPTTSGVYVIKVGKAIAANIFTIQIERVVKRA